MSSQSETKVPIHVESTATRRRDRSGRSSHSVTVRRGHVSVEAANVTDAKVRFAEVVEAFFDADTTPEVLTFGGAAFVFYAIPGCELPTPTWCYTIIDTTTNRRGCTSSTSATDRHGARQAVKRHLVQYSSDYADVANIQAGYDYLAGDDDAQYEHLRYAAWQRAAKTAQGLAETDVHQWACDHQREYFDRLLPLIRIQSARRPA